MGAWVHVWEAVVYHCTFGRGDEKDDMLILYMTGI